jgi:hypothetical protein
MRLQASRLQHPLAVERLRSAQAHDSISGAQDTRRKPSVTMRATTPASVAPANRGRIEAKADVGVRRRLPPDVPTVSMEDSVSV